MFWLLSFYLLKIFFQKNKTKPERDVPLEFSKEEIDVLPHWVTSGQ